MRSVRIQHVSDFSQDDPVAVQGQCQFPLGWLERGESIDRGGRCGLGLAQDGANPGVGVLQVDTGSAYSRCRLVEQAHQPNCPARTGFERFVIGPQDRAVGDVVDLVLGIATGGLLLPVALIIGIVGGMAVGSAAGASIPNSDVPDQWDHQKACRGSEEYRFGW